jgi:hypothetical protein
MAKDPYAKCIKKLIKLVKSADKRVQRTKRQLAKVLGTDGPDPFPVKFVDCSFEVDRVSYEARLSAGQCEMIKEIIAKGGGAKDVVEKLQELLRKVDTASVEAQQALAAALLTPTSSAAQSGSCPPDLGCCTYNINGDMAKAACISQAQCDALGGTWQPGPC